MGKIISSTAGVLVAAVLTASIGTSSAEARSRHHSRANAAAVGAVIGLFGTIATLAARDSYRDRYYYGGGPYYYGSPYAYSPPVYRYRHWHRRHHRW